MAWNDVHFGNIDRYEIAYLVNGKMIVATEYRKEAVEIAVSAALMVHDFGTTVNVLAFASPIDVTREYLEAHATT